MTKLTAKYNEYGYVIFKSSRPIYAAGNSAYESQGYVGSELTRGVVSKKPIPEDAGVLSLDAIAKYCESTVTNMVERPELIFASSERMANMSWVLSSSRRA